MKIVHLSTRTEFYGGEVCLANLARGMADLGHDVTCLVRPGSALAARLSPGAVEVVELPLVDWYDPGTIRRVRRCLRRIGTGVFATHSPRDYFIAAVASLGLPLENVATRHVLEPITWPLLKRPFLRRFAAVVAVSDAVAREVSGIGLVPPDRVRTVANGIAEPGPVPGGEGLRERAGVPARVPVIGFMGRLSPAKGPADVIRAAALVVERLPELQLFIVGAGEARGDYRSHLEDLVRETGLSGHVHFFGYLPDAARFGRDFDVQVVASAAEPFGLVTLEAMANRVPIVATATGGSPEIVRDGNEGFLIKPGDVAALANRLECLLTSPGLRAQMGARGRRRYESTFTLERMIKETEAVYRGALVSEY